MLDQLVATLKGMTGTRPWGGAYPNNPVVERTLKMPAQVTQFPHLCMIEASGSTLRQQSLGGGTALFQHDFRATIYGYVIGTSAATRSTWLQRLWDDVVRELLKTSTLGGLVRDVRIDGELETDEGELEGVGAFAQGVTAIFDEAFTVA